MSSIYDFTVKDRKGNDVSLKDYEGKVLLIVNTATGCGFTPHYDPLEAMYTTSSRCSGRVKLRFSDAKQPVDTPPVRAEKP